MSDRPWKDQPTPSMERAWRDGSTVMSFSVREVERRARNAEGLLDDLVSCKRKRQNVEADMLVHLAAAKEADLVRAGVTGIRLAKPRELLPDGWRAAINRAQSPQTLARQRDKNVTKI